MSAYMLSFRDCAILGHRAALLFGGSPSDWGRLFHEENRASVQYRYPDDLPWDLPGVEAEEVGTPYRHDPEAGAMARGMSAVALATLVACWQYQTCEHPGHETGEAWRASEAIERAVGKRETRTLHGKAAWGDYSPATDPGLWAPAEDAITAMLGTTIDAGDGSSPDVPVRLYGRDLSTAIKQHLADTFPGVTFSVKGSRGTGTGWFSVSWTDGPTSKAVGAEVGRFESSRFDGMDDGYHATGNDAVKVRGRWVRGTSCGINCHRTISEALARKIAADIATRTNWPMPTGEYRRGDWWNQSPTGDRHRSWQHYVGRAVEGEVTP